MGDETAIKRVSFLAERKDFDLVLAANHQGRFVRIIETVGGRIANLPSHHASSCWGSPVG